MEIKYKYNEKKLLNDLQKYIDHTYSEHYSMQNIQATEFIIDAGLGEGFTLGNVIKYAQRYGKKDGYNRKDLLKVLLYICTIGIMNLAAEFVYSLMMPSFFKSCCQKSFDNWNNLIRF